ncbi:hypothetical protein E2542_SST11197 [Spatholobus suberectus]|nr:hypothetical protein E2542_SST11197 [Spatholobus suberectus]
MSSSFWLTGRDYLALALVPRLQKCVAFLLLQSMEKESLSLTSIIGLDHDGYKGSSRSSWNCYFFLGTSLECRQRALELMKSEDAWSKGILTTRKLCIKAYVGRTNSKDMGRAMELFATNN